MQAGRRGLLWSLTMRTTRRTAGFYAFYWAGVIMAFACVAVVLAGNTQAVYRFEHARFPLLWAFAGVTVIAFLAAELCIVAAARNDKPGDGSSQVPQAPPPAPAARTRRGPSSGGPAWQEESRRAEAGKSGVPA